MNPCCASTRFLAQVAAGAAPRPARDAGTRYLDATIVPSGLSGGKADGLTPPIKAARGGSAREGAGLQAQHDGAGGNATFPAGPGEPEGTTRTSRKNVVAQATRRSQLHNGMVAYAQEHQARHHRAAPPCARRYGPEDSRLMLEPAPTTTRARRRSISGRRRSKRIELYWMDGGRWMRQPDLLLRLAERELGQASKSAARDGRGPGFYTRREWIVARWVWAEPPSDASASPKVGGISPALKVSQTFCGSRSHACEVHGLAARPNLQVLGAMGIPPRDVREGPLTRTSISTREKRPWLKDVIGPGR